MLQKYEAELIEELRKPQRADLFSVFQSLAGVHLLFVSISISFEPNNDAQVAQI